MHPSGVESASFNTYMVGALFLMQVQSILLITKSGANTEARIVIVIVGTIKTRNVGGSLSETKVRNKGD